MLRNVTTAVINVITAARKTIATGKGIRKTKTLQRQPHGTEELAHLEMVGAMVHQLMDNVPPKELEKLHVDTLYAVHGYGVYPSDSNGVPFTAAYIESMSDPIANLNENLAAEQKARATYEYLIHMAEDPDVIDPLRFLREREVVHYQRFGEALRIVQEKMQEKKFF